MTNVKIAPSIRFEGGTWLPAVLTVGEACNVLRISDKHAYRKIRAGTFPVPVLTVLGRYKVPTHAVMEYLGVNPGTAA